MKITIVGAGGMGSRFALMLHRSGADVTLVDGWQANVDAIRADGLQADFNGTPVVAKLPIYTPADIATSGVQADLIIAFTKSNQLADMFAQIRPIIHPDTYVLCLLNGLGHEDVLGQFVARDHLLLGITMWTAGMTGPGHVRLLGDGEVELQNFAPAGHAFALDVVSVFKQAGLNPKYSPDVRASIWRKACVNGTLNSLCALLDCNIGQLGQTREATPFLREIIAEFATVAAADGVTLDQDEVCHHVAETFTADIAAHYPSMHQDLVVNHRLTEVDFINGAVVRKGQQHGIPTPYNTMLTQLIHAKEQLVHAQ
ncbi:2-dehydropantoate 2-reductase [Lacticaseibacillus absianus]|uniref:2-dehydropantoate 2-reductase n=1 Tax=Lacticaseibacillus absianus TaxID=2729623 RepID=UPI0015CDDA74|nr:2-dehydropantoate 2-reductase [Lacticaseibacillus absianus]